MASKAYTYLLRHKPTNTFYYGVRWAKGCTPEEFWVKYFTSSQKLVPLYRTLFGDDSFEFEIRHTFKTPKSARSWEEKVLRRMRVLEKPDIWLNRSNNRAILNEVHPRGTLGKKKPHSEAAKAAMRKPKKNTKNMGRYVRTARHRQIYAENARLQKQTRNSGSGRFV